MKIAAVFLKIFLGVGLAAAASSPYVYVKYFKNVGTTAQAPNNVSPNVLPTNGNQQTTNTPPTSPTVATPSTSSTSQNPFRFGESGQQGFFETSMPGGS